MAERGREWPSARRFLCPAVLGLSVATLLLVSCGKTGEEWAGNVIEAQERGKAAGASSDMQSLAVAITSYATDEGTPPVASDINALASLLEPRYTRRVKRNDPWGKEYEYSCDGTSYRIASAGLDGKWGTEDDLVNEDGTMTQLPKGFRKF